MTESRPWYLSITARFRDAAGHADLKQVIESTVDSYLPSHHLRIAESAWHFTVLAIARLSIRNSARAADDAALETLQRAITARSEIPAVLQRSFEGFSMEVYEVRAYDTTTSVQLRSRDDRLARFRDNACAEFQQLDLPSLSTGDTIVSSILSDTWKNRGGNAFGAVARASGRDEATVLRYSLPVPPVRLEFDTVHLVCSDETLTNPNSDRHAIAIRCGARRDACCNDKK